MLPLLHLCMITSNSKVRDDPQTKLILTFSLALNCFEDAHMHLSQFWQFAKKFDVRAPYSWISKVEYLFYDVFAHDSILCFWTNPDIFGKKRQPWPETFSNATEIGLVVFFAGKTGMRNFTKGPSMIRANKVSTRIHHAVSFLRGKTLESPRFISQWVERHSWYVAQMQTSKHFLFHIQSRNSDCLNYKQA